MIELFMPIDLQEKNTEFKPTVHRLKIDFVSYSDCRGVDKYILFLHHEKSLVWSLGCYPMLCGH